MWVLDLNLAYGLRAFILDLTLYWLTSICLGWLVPPPQVTFFVWLSGQYAFLNFFPIFLTSPSHSSCLFLFLAFLNINTSTLEPRPSVSSLYSLPWWSGNISHDQRTCEFWQLPQFYLQTNIFTESQPWVSKCLLDISTLKYTISSRKTEPNPWCLPSTTVKQFLFSRFLVLP